MTDGILIVGAPLPRQQGLSTAEIAKRLGRKESTVKAHLWDPTGDQKPERRAQELEHENRACFARSLTDRGDAFHEALAEHHWRLISPTVGSLDPAVVHAFLDRQHPINTGVVTHLALSRSFRSGRYAHGLVCRWFKSFAVRRKVRFKRWIGDLIVRGAVRGGQHDPRAQRQRLRGLAPTRPRFGWR
jgi:hypothetical protein